MANGLTEHIGIMVSQDLDDCLRLKSLLQEKGRSEIIRDIVIEYVEEKNWDSTEMIDAYAYIIYERWKLHWQDKMNFAAHLKNVKKNLEEKYKFPDRLTNSIIQKCKEVNIR